MSFQDYVDHISQKYRLAVAISVIKTKPNHLSIDEYLTQLQNKIKDKEYDPNETVCSEDFNLDDNDILKENMQAEKCDVLNENRLGYSVNENEREGSQTILNDFVFGDGPLEPSMEGETSIGSTLKLLKEVATITKEEDPNQNISQLTFCESQEAINNENNDVTFYETSNAEGIQNGNENCMDSQETQLYTLHGFTQDFTHVSQTQNEYFEIADKYITNKGNNSSNIRDNAKDRNGQKGHMQIHVSDQNAFENIVDGTANIGNVHLAQQNENDYGNTNVSQYLQNVKKYTANNRNDGLNDDKAIGQVAFKEVEIQNVDNAQKLPFSAMNSLAIDKAANHNSTEKAARKVTCNNIFETNINTLNKDIETPLLSFNSQNTLPNEFTVRDEIQNNHIEHKNSNCKDGHDINKETAETNQNSLNIENVEQEINENIENNDMEIDETASDENTQEKVPFKVIEELNRVKNFVNKKDKRYDGYSTDSGYRSESQHRSSLKTVSQHGTWLNQSAHCLFNHILQAAATDDIVKQIAQVLGKLIDKLHEEENYPHFLEELLETVDSTLLDMRLGGGWADDALVSKDENIKRLLLLNKSKHILKYTIEKITTTLEELHTSLTQELTNLYELTNIVEVENICYIFHVLELLLKRYMKIKDVSSQNTQNSQEELPTRSSLTELWRKKWYPNSNKEVTKNENKICILKRCSDILNKIIVECMDGYSLIAFVALQCFNLIQG